MKNKHNPDTTNQTNDLIEIDTLNLKINYGGLVVIALITAVALAWAVITKVTNPMIYLGILSTGSTVGMLLYAALNLKSLYRTNNRILENNQRKHTELLESQQNNHKELVALEKSHHDALIEQDKKRKASELMQQWTQPEMTKIITYGPIVREKVKDMSGREIHEYLETTTDHYECVICILNFLEKLYHMIENDMLHESLLKSYFSGIVKAYDLRFRKYVEYKQSLAHGDKSVLEGFLKLAERWSN